MRYHEERAKSDLDEVVLLQQHCQSTQGAVHLRKLIG